MARGRGRERDRQLQLVAQVQSHLLVFTCQLLDRGCLDNLCQFRRPWQAAAVVQQVLPHRDQAQALAGSIIQWHLPLQQPPTQEVHGWLLQQQRRRRQQAGNQRRGGGRYRLVACRLLIADEHPRLWMLQ